MELFQEAFAQFPQAKQPLSSLGTQQRKKASIAQNIVGEIRCGHREIDGLARLHRSKPKGVPGARRAGRLRLRQGGPGSAHGRWEIDPTHGSRSGELR